MEKIIFYLLISLTTISSNLLAQQEVIDSLYKSLQENNIPDSIRINQINKLATIIGYSDKKQSDSLFKQAINLARQSKNVYGEVRALIGLSNFNRELRNFSSSRQFLSQALHVAQKNQSKHFITEAVNDFYQNYFPSYGGDYIQQLEFSLYYLKLAEQYEMPELIADAYTNIGVAYAYLGNYSRAIDYQNRALKTLDQKENANASIRMNTLLSLGDTYRLQKKYDQAIQILNQSLQLANQLHSLAYIVNNQSYLADVYEKQKHYKETFITAFQALSIYTELKDYSGQAYITYILARAYLNTNKPDSALFFGKLSLQLAQKLDREGIRNAHEVLSKGYAVEKDFKRAYFHHVLYTDYKDSLFNKINAQQAAYLEYSAELLQKETKISLYKQEQEKEALIKKILIASVLVLLLLAFIIVRNISLKRRNEAHQWKLAENELQIQKLESEKTKVEMQREATELQIKAMVATQEQERKRISRDLHDDVGTKLSALNLYLSSLTEKATAINNDEIKSLACSSKQFIKETMHDVRQLLFNLSPTVLEEFGYTTAVEGLVNKINETKQIHFDLIVFGMNHRLKKDYELALYRITQELINNVLKHAEAKHVSLQIGQRDEKIILMMEDDGKGFDVSAHKDGYGLNNLDARTKLMQGIMTIDSQPGKGTSVLIEVPYSFNGI